MSSRREFVGHLAAGAALTTLAGGVALELEGCTYDWITTAIDDIPTITSIITTVASIVVDAMGAGAVSPAVGAVIQTAATATKVALTLLQQLINDYKSNPSATTLEKIKTTLLDVQSQIGSILDAAHVFNVALRATITFTLGVGITVLTQILSLVPSTTTASLTAQKTQVKATAIKPWTKTQIQSQCASYLNANGYGKYVWTN